MRQVLKLGASVCGLLMSAMPLSSIAEDIDLFLGESISSGDVPNVLFIIDNTANWSESASDPNDASIETAWDIEKTALINVFNSLDPDRVNIGLLLYTETGGGNSNIDGGYIRSAIRLMTTTNKGLYAQQISDLDIQYDAGNGGKSALGFAEAYAYFDGADARSGNNKVKTDYLGNTDGTRTVKEDCDTHPSGKCDVTLDGDNRVWEVASDDDGNPLNALDAKDGTTYNSPVEDGSCAKNYIIFISNGPNQDNAADTRTAEEILEGLGGDISQIDITPGGNASNASDEWSRFMANSEYDITTFTIDANKSDLGQGPNWTALLKSIADVSGGEYCEADLSIENITECINFALSQILATNSVFASVALPASANTQSTFLNQVYIGQFRPDADSRPRWLGNVKQYKLGFDTTQVDVPLVLKDANDVPVIDGNSGFIKPCGRSFWTPTGASSDNYWDHYDPNDITAFCTLASKFSNSPDGPIVEKGGQAYMGRGGSTYTAADPNERVVLAMEDVFCTGAAACDEESFVTTNSTVSAAILTADATVDANDVTTMMDWARGADTKEEDGHSNTAIRPSVHGDVVHAQPIALDYARDPNNPRVVVFYGSNDGMLRAVNGNRSTAHNGVAIDGSNSAAAGEEFWSFMPPDFFAGIKRIYDNSERIKFPATGAFAPVAGSPKFYGPDGPVTAIDDGSSRYLYMTMRRGGRTIYGFDVTTVSSPLLMFRHGCSTPIGAASETCESGWSEIGQTWSPMTPIYVDTDGMPSTAPATYLIMGGGYDPCEDYDDPNQPANHQCNSSTKGDKIYVLDATTGAIVQEFDTARAVPGKITVVPVSDDNQAAQWAYAADSGGNVYRISGATANTPIGATLPSSAVGSGWTITKIAGFGCDAGATTTCDANRKFLFGPDVVRVPDTTLLGIMLGSGDREKPLLDYGGAASVQNYFFGMFEDPTSSTQYNSISGSCGAAMLCASEMTTLSNDPNDVVPSTVASFGWKMSMSSTEQVVSGALTVADVVNFSTHTPDDSSGECSNDLGKALTYNIGYRRGAIDDIVDIIGGGLVPTPVAGKVVLDDGQVVPFCIGCGGENSAIGGGQTTSGITWQQPKSRVYWKIEK